MKKKLGGRGRGRPAGTYKDAVSDPDGPAVVLLDAQLRFGPLRGVRVPERDAARWASAAVLGKKWGVEGPVKYDHPPPQELATHRSSPRKRSLLGGYEEFFFKCSETSLLSTADRVRKKRRAWRKRPDIRRRLSKSSFSLALLLYPSLDKAEMQRRHEETR